MSSWALDALAYSHAHQHKSVACLGFEREVGVQLEGKWEDYTGNRSDDCVVGNVRWRQNGCTRERVWHCHLGSKLVKTGELYKKIRWKYTTDDPRITKAVLKFNATLNADDFTKSRYFSNGAPQVMTYLSHLDTSCKTHSPQKSCSCIHNHSQPATYTCS
jgi:hypothetical protein